MLTITPATKARLSQQLDRLDQHTRRAIEHPKAYLSRTRINGEDKIKYGVCAPSADPDCIHNIPYFHQLPYAIYHALYITNNQ